MPGYYIQATPGVLIILVRHGSTELNSAAKTIVRGWKDTELDNKGRLAVQLTAQKLRKFNAQHIISSDFTRDTQTKFLLAAALGISNLDVDYDARTWDVGAFSGQPEEEVQPAINELYRRTNERPPGSQESFDEFSERWFRLLDKKIEEARNISAMRPIIITTHGRNIALTDSKYNFKLPIEGRMPFPAGYALLSIGDDSLIQFDIAPPDECVCEDK